MKLANIRVISLIDIQRPSLCQIELPAGRKPGRSKPCESGHRGSKPFESGQAAWLASRQRQEKQIRFIRDQKTRGIGSYILQPRQVDTCIYGARLPTRG